ncbi:hypothetical protein NDU88_003516 [Pleurodeles waltl]|uniref:Uncharacterized protein n=1 Tax=Pleurodeles waltl TaxID=8319 RepID=A0AAV7P9T2_PLEWA|nr:hypothetical protein NDU88_003516 [Pleurodeles waltl]
MSTASFFLKGELALFRVTAYHGRCRRLRIVLVLRLYAGHSHPERQRLEVALPMAKHALQHSYWGREERNLLIPLCAIRCVGTVAGQRRLWPEVPGRTDPHQPLKEEIGSGALLFPLLGDRQQAGHACSVAGPGQRRGTSFGVAISPVSPGYGKLGKRARKDLLTPLIGR